jgi:hypothetical protein
MAGEFNLEYSFEFRCWIGEARARWPRSVFLLKSAFPISSSVAGEY